jgi:hypothetical protein
MEQMDEPATMTPAEVQQMIADSQRVSNTGFTWVIVDEIIAQRNLVLTADEEARLEQRYFEMLGGSQTLKQLLRNL